MKLKKTIKISALVLLSIVVILAATFFIARGVNAATSKIDLENGVQRTEFITLGGIEQYIQIRGEDRENPVIVFLHGGPGSTVGYMSCHWQGRLETDYTVVHWDQRGCANTYYRNKNAERPTLELLLSDLDELVDYVRTEFDEEKVVIIGHSWGSVLGSLYVGEHPEKVSHYVSIGQVVDTMRGEELAMLEAVRLATEAGHLDTAVEIRESFDRVMAMPELDIAEFFQLRSLTTAELPSGNALSQSELTLMCLFSPDTTLADFRWFNLASADFDTYFYSNAQLAAVLFLDGGISIYEHITEFEVPVTFISGDCDWITPYTEVERYYNDITAPQKEYILLENLGHSPYLDNPELFTQALLYALSR